MKKGLISILLTVVLACGLLTGCSQSNEPGTPADTTEEAVAPETEDSEPVEEPVVSEETVAEESEETAEVAENPSRPVAAEELDPSWMEVQSAEESGEQLRVAFSTMNITNDNYMATMADTIKEYTEGLGHEFVLSVASTSWGAPVSMQVNAIENLISADIDVLIFHAFDANALIPVIQKCNDAGIVCVNVESQLADDSLFVTFVGGDNVVKGTVGAQGLLEDFPDVKKYMLLGGAEGNPSTLDRTEAFKTYMTENVPDSECVGDYFANADSDTAMSYVQNTLISDPDLDAIYAVSDSMIPGIVQALKQAGKAAGDVKVVGTDGIAYVVTEIESGWVTGDVLSQAQGTVLPACQIAISARQGLLQTDMIPKNIGITCPYVDIDNLSEYADSFY